MSEEPTTRGERTQVEIVQAAHRLFLQHGYHGTSMRQIARQAGIAVGGIYNHFASKEDIFFSVLRDYHPYHEILPALIVAPGDTIEDFVRHAATSMLKSLDRRPDFLNLMLIEIVEFKTQHIPQLFEVIFPQFMSLMQTFASRRGKLRLIPLPMVIRAFIGLFFSFYITEVLLEKQFPPEIQHNALDYFVEIFLHGIVSEES